MGLRGRGALVKAIYRRLDPDRPRCWAHTGPRLDEDVAGARRATAVGALTDTGDMETV
jgi:hypothetical protein